MSRRGALLHVRSEVRGPAQLECERAPDELRSKARFLRWSYGWAATLFPVQLQAPPFVCILDVL
jgi:hypothetical protein